MTNPVKLINGFIFMNKFRHLETHQTVTHRGWYVKVWEDKGYLPTTKEASMEPNRILQVPKSCQTIYVV